MNDYGMGTLFAIPFEEAVEATTAALKTEGFGVLTDVDGGAAPYKQTLNIDFCNTRPQGACNSTLSYQKLQYELEIGVLMPCSVIVYKADDGRTAVMIADPLAMINVTLNPGLKEIAEAARAKLFRVLKNLSQLEYNLYGMFK